MRAPKFVLIDDNTIDLMVNERLLKNAFTDLSVRAFKNTTDALDFFSANTQSPAQLPDVLLLDIIMPGMDGFQVLGELQKIFNGAIPFRIFMLSSTLDSADFIKAQSSNLVTSVLGKPLETDLLIDLMQ